MVFVTQKNSQTRAYLWLKLVTGSTLGLALMLSGCASQKSKLEAGPEKSDKAYYEAAQRELKVGRFDDAANDLKALENFYPTSRYTEQSQLDLMYAKYRLSDYPMAVAVAERFIKFYGTNPQVDYAYYLRGVANMEQGQSAVMHFFKQNPAERDISQLRIAFDNFKELVTLYPQSKFAPDALQRMLYIRNLSAENELVAAQFYVKRGAYQAAINRASAIVQFYPTAPVVPAALQLLVDCYTQIGNADMAKQYKEVMALNALQPKSNKIVAYVKSIAAPDKAQANTAQ